MTIRFFIMIMCITTLKVFSQSSEQGAQISSIVGSVEVRSGESAVWRKARIGMPVRTNWDIRTLLESTADITLESGTVIKVNENTVISLAKLYKDPQSSSLQSNVKVLSGQIWANVKKMTNSTSQFDFETPTAVASIRGTRLGIEVSKERTRIDVFEGLIAVRKRNSNSSFSVKPNSRAEVENNSTNVRIIEFRNIKMDDSGAADGPVPHDPFNPGGTLENGSINSDPNSYGDNQLVLNDSIKTSQPEAGGSAPVLQIIAPISGDIVHETPQIIRGNVTPGATVRINNVEVETGPDGTFGDIIDLKTGVNVVLVVSFLSGIQTSQQVKIDYRPNLELSVGNIENNMEVSSRNLQLDITVNENAKFSVNGKVGEVNVSLAEGPNEIIIEAWDEWNSRTIQQFRVIYVPETGFNLKLISPVNGARLNEPFIQITGSTNAGAKVYINDVMIQVGRDGFFSKKMPIADEPQEYELEIRAELSGKEFIEQRVVIYEPQQKKLTLEVISPQKGQVIVRKSIRVAGQTIPKTHITVNGLSIPVLLNGTFTYDLPVHERNIGDFTIEVVGRNHDQDLSKTVNVIISGTSDQINTSVPQCIVSTKNLRAIRTNTVLIQTLDRTPHDVLTLTITNNGIIEQISTESGENEQFSFQEGKNNYFISVRDMAGNSSNVVSGDLYYLPGPLQATIVKPSENPVIIRGVPPMPGKKGLKPLVVEVEISDGIGNVPETIKYCKLIGNGQNVLLRNNNDYLFKGEAAIVRGHNTYLIQVEDIAGNTASTRFEIYIE